MLHVLQYLSIACAFLLPWGVFGSVEAYRAGERKKFRRSGLLALVSLGVIGLTVGVAFALH